MIKAISFDLWETLITDTPDASRAQAELRLTRMEAILRNAGYTDSAQRIHDAHRTSWQRCQELYWSADRDIPCRTQVEHFLDVILSREDGEEARPDERDSSRSAALRMTDEVLDALEDAYARAAVEILPSIVAGGTDVVRQFDADGYTIGLISNTGRTPGYALREILDALGLAPHFDAMVFSNEHGFCKPQQSIFEELRSKLGVAFDEMVFVGDNLYADVHGAQRCGMRAVHFVPPKRGTAIAPHVDHGLEIVPDATITELRELPPIVSAWSDSPASPSTSHASSARARTHRG